MIDNIQIFIVRIIKQALWKRISSYYLNCLQVLLHTCNSRNDCGNQFTCQSRYCERPTNNFNTLLKYIKYIAKLEKEVDN